MRRRGFAWVPALLWALAAAPHAVAEDARPAASAVCANEVKARAEAGDAAAQTALGEAAWARGQLALWLDPRDRGSDLLEALRWFGKAAAQGHAPAQYDLGVMHHNGEGVLQDTAEAACWYRKAADQGHAKAQHDLGLLRDAGEGVPQDRAEAARWFRKAAEQGLAGAQAALGRAYATGTGVVEDPAQAYFWFHLAAALRREAGDAGAARARDAIAAQLPEALVLATRERCREWMEAFQRRTEPK